jgi:hypothetical protein
VAGLVLNAVGKIEVVNETDVRLHFAAEIAATALRPHLPDGNPKNFEELLQPILEANRYAVKCVQILVDEEIWNRFGR